MTLPRMISSRKRSLAGSRNPPLASSNYVRVRQALHNRAMVDWASAQSLSTRLLRQIGWVELRDLESSLAKLPEEQRSVVMSIGWDDEHYERIAARLGVLVGTVRSRLSRGRTRLRELTDTAPPPPHGSQSQSRPAASSGLPVNKEPGCDQ
jgi:DNA-directed RNA polymerase specialized sigma24 family protein